MARGVARLEDGHTAYASSYVCELDPGFSHAISNVGACATEIDGSLFVYRAVPAGADDTASDTGLNVGDELLAIDGRSVEELLADIAAQPRCTIAASTPAQARARAVASVLFRAERDAVITVRRARGHEEDLPISLASSVIDCDGRVGVPSSAMLASDARGLRAGGLYAGGVEGALLAGDVGYVHFPLFGAFSGDEHMQELADAPTIAGLRALFADFDDAGARGLIVDLRSNGGGFLSVAMALATWLLESATDLFACRARAGAAHDDFSELVVHRAAPDAELRVDVPIIVLTSPTSFSAADFTALFLRDTGRARTMGAPTGGGFGASHGEAFGADFLEVSDVACHRPRVAAAAGESDDGALEGHPPDVDVPLTYTPDDLARGEDTLIEAARRRLAR
jgi:C-terminal processing protease CtpA/Prc